MVGGGPRPHTTGGRVEGEMGYPQEFGTLDVCCGWCDVECSQYRRSPPVVPRAESAVGSTIAISTSCSAATRSIASTRSISGSTWPPQYWQTWSELAR